MATKRTKTSGKNKRSAVKDLPPKNARKVKGGSLYDTLASLQRTMTDTKMAIIKNMNT